MSPFSPFISTPATVQVPSPNSEFIPQTAVYLRVSTAHQTTRSHKPDLERWLNAQDPEKLGKVVWYSDTATVKNMDRPRWKKLQESINAGYGPKLPAEKESLPKEKRNAIFYLRWWI